MKAIQALLKAEDELRSMDTAQVFDVVAKEIEDNLTEIYSKGVTDETINNDS